MEQVGNNLPFSFFYVAAGVGKTGLADVAVDVYKNNSLIITADAATEVGDGFYSYTLLAVNVDVAGKYLAVAKTADGTVSQKHVPDTQEVGLAGIENLNATVSSRATPAQVETSVWDAPTADHTDSDTFGGWLGFDIPAAIAANVWNHDPASFIANTAGAMLSAILTRVGLIGVGSITVVSPIASDGTTLSLVRGDDYLLAHGRQITYTSTAWPDLTGAAVVLTIRRRKEAFSTGSDGILLVRQDTLASRQAGGSPQVVVFELSAVIGLLTAPNSGGTAVLLPGNSTGKYDVQATLTSGEIITLLTGVVSVTEDQTRP